MREAYPPEEHEAFGRAVVADLRAAVARRGSDAAATTLVDRRHHASPEFSALWERHEVAVRRQSRLRLLHPEAGAMEFDFEVLLTPAEDQQVRLFTPPPNSPTTAALGLLKVVGPASVHRRHRRHRRQTA